MDIFWQITLVEALLNVAIFAIAVIGFGLLKGATAKANWPKTREDIVVGLLFGTATALALLMPIHIGGGAALGCQSILIALAGALAGPVATLSAVGAAALIMLGASHILEFATGWVDIFAIVGAALAGLGISFLSKSRRPGLTYIELPLLGGSSAIAGLIGLAVLEGASAGIASFWPTLAANLVATGVLGTLLLHEVRRERAERDVRLSETELRKANQQLVAKALEIRLAWEKAEELSRAKSQFLAMMSHELRTPLNAVIGFAQIIRDKVLGEQSDLYGEYAADIAASGQHLLAVISDILEFSRAQAGIIELAKDEIDLSVVVADCGRMLNAQANAKRMTLASCVKDRLPLLRGDERRVRQILLNLLSNALKFTPAGGAIAVAARENSSGGIELVVEDTGIGIPDADLFRVLEPFYQVDGRLSRSQEGTGLGLPLSKHLVELHEATLSLRNRDGGGLIATVSFPASRVVRLAPDKSEEPPQILSARVRGGR